METARQRTMHSPLGELTVSEFAGHIVAIDWGRGAEQASSALLREATDQLNAYFDDQRHVFDLPLAPAGTAFQKKVWAALAQIPYGATETYGAVARSLGSSARAVGGACGRNPIPIVVPCHRVVAAKLTDGGYSGGEGLKTKLALLRLERAILC
ncbi:MAG: methylated-DNA--[protein]-cysteine S-methyltransferase [Alphaproteobacteria bacterium]|nr:methylated-DNA--[protein]-cysteine S-methyltransferase [Alphaproteobacteria bacterium]